MNSLWDIYRRVVTVLVKALALCSGIGVLVMMAVTCGDIIGRKFGHSITGAVDIVQVAACVAAICALPYTTAVKGHIAVEVFSQKFPRTVRAILDGLWRIAVMLMYAIMSWRCIVYGCTLLKRHSSTLTIHIPLFWVLWVMSVCCAIMALVKLYNLTHPGKEMMKP